MNFFPEIAKYSLLVSVLASFFIVKKADKTWLPFFLFLYAGIITEFISTYLQKNGRSNAVITNIYAIVEILLIIWLFHNWSLFRSKKISVLFGGIFILAFITENFIINKPHSFNLYLIF